MIGPRPRALALAAAAALAAAPARAEPPRDEPWEPEPASAREAPPPAPPAPSYRPLADLALWAIGRYQRDIGPTSIARCRFARSCSRFAARAIDEEGALVGLLLFWDRFFYRENDDAFRQYRWVRTPGGAVRLDDEVEAR
ncbi:MAG TPA: membrane protein insertion efficiency factor YidD [Polyangiaceae bacterium]|nr:membrane protein insertion efficiency factor YidD [Polyangiaceae bacterium]